MPSWLKPYFAEVWGLHVEAEERAYQAYKRGGMPSETVVAALNVPVLFFSPFPPLAKAIRWTLFGI